MTHRNVLFSDFITHDLSAQQGWIILIWLLREKRHRFIVHTPCNKHNSSIFVHYIMSSLLSTSLIYSPSQLDIKEYFPVYRSIVHTVSAIDLGKKFCKSLKCMLPTDIDMVWLVLFPCTIIVCVRPSCLCIVYH